MSAPSNRIDAAGLTFSSAILDLVLVQPAPGVVSSRGRAYLRPESDGFKDAGALG